MANEKFRPKQFHAGFNFLNFILYTFIFIYLVFISFSHILSVFRYERLSLPGIFILFFFNIGKQYVYMYMYIILDLQRCTVGIQTLVCIHQDTQTWFDILYR